MRPGDDLYTDCVVAIDASNGKTKWYYQTVPHDVWDLDAVSPPVVASVGGKKVVVHAGKTGWVVASWMSFGNPNVVDALFACRMDVEAIRQKGLGESLIGAVNLTLGRG